MNSIDREINESSLPEPDIVKIDVEGVELDVLHGMTETIARRKPRLFVEIHGSDAEAKRANAERVIGFLAEHDYSIHHVESDRRVTPPTSERALDGHIYCV